jgi:hypothetical protein
MQNALARALDCIAHSCTRRTKKEIGEKCSPRRCLPLRAAIRVTLRFRFAFILRK